MASRLLKIQYIPTTTGTNAPKLTDSRIEKTIVPSCPGQDCSLSNGFILFWATPRISAEQTHVHICLCLSRIIQMLHHIDNP